MKRYKLICVAGARPNFMKVAPLLRLLGASQSYETVLVHTGQHYDEGLSGHFFRDLELPAPDYYLGVGSSSHAQQTAEVMKRFEPVVKLEQPDAVVVVGDVNSTMAAAIVAVKLGVAVFHVEAGLRSFDRSMPEEINRIVTDVLSDVLLVTESSGRTNLRNEGVPEHRIHLVGNLMIDSLLHRLSAARDSDVLDRLSIVRQSYGLLTLHRPSNVDHKTHLQEILEAVSEISNTVPLIFPVHPRTRAQLSGHSKLCGNVTLVDPMGYIDFLCLMVNSSVVLTDSGGVQEETTALGIPCLTLRKNTERPITIEQGTNILAGTTKATILSAWNELREHPRTGRIPPLWDGAAAQRCLGVFRDFFEAERFPRAFAASEAEIVQQVCGAASGSTQKSIWHPTAL
jgi:UDP-N-acetylglucosamine 2-epimerase (non-hydrolysing)